MIVHLLTGGFRDFIELVAETTQECCQLARVESSTMIEIDRVYLDLSDDKTIRLQIWVSAPRAKNLDVSTRDAIDSTP